jgi:proteasome lid subunit RPN8/RPN11
LVVGLPLSLRQQLIQIARQGAPDEVCGILAGRDGRVSHIFPVRNAAEEVSAEHGMFRDRASGSATAGRKPVHYYMDPRDQLRVYNDIDELELDVVGYYHSHTHTEARPSPTDIRLASDLAAVYVLVSLTDQPAVRAWRIIKADPGDETGELVELPLT